MVVNWAFLKMGREGCRSGSRKESEGFLTQLCGYEWWEVMKCF